MAKAKLKYVKHDKYRWDLITLFYEYRGHEYIVTSTSQGFNKANMAMQHEEEQRRIDSLIENANIDPKKYNPESEQALDKLFEYWETGILNKY